MTNFQKMHRTFENVTLGTKASGESKSAAKTHAIERTSPKGGPFIGTCWQCGKAGLKMSDALEPCENIAALTEDESLIIAIDPPQRESEDNA